MIFYINKFFYKFLINNLLFNIKMFFINKKIKNESIQRIKIFGNFTLEAKINLSIRVNL